MIVTDERFFALFRKYDGPKKSEIKMKKPNQLTEVLELSKQLLHEQQVLMNATTVQQKSFSIVQNSKKRPRFECANVKLWKASYK